MGVHFRGGEFHQKGRGIGGFFRGLAAIFKPMMKSAGSNVVKAVKSRTAKEIASSLAKQSIDSSLNMTRDLINGGSLKDSMEHERRALKNVGVKIIGNLQKRNRKRKKSPYKNQPKKTKRSVTLKSMRRYE